jgi:hypothetical protein
LLRRHGLGERGGGKLIDLLARYAVLLGQVLGRLDHVDAGGRVLQRLPHVVLEAHRGAQLEAGAVREGGDRVARHGLGAREQRHVGAAALDLLAGLAEQLKTRAADALRHDGRHLDRHAGVQADVARQKELVEVARRHVAGDDRADVAARYAGAFQCLTRGLDAKVGRADVAQRAAVIDHGCAHAVEHPDVVEGGEESFGGHVEYSVSKSPRAAGRCSRLAQPGFPRLLQASP